MEPRSIQFLTNMLDSDLQWRIKELSNFRTCIPRDPGTAQNSLIRGGITLLYAHWEGFVKYASLQYYRFVGFQTHNIGDLRSSFISLILSSEVNELLDTSRISLKSTLLDKILNEMPKRAILPRKHPIKTSNLHYHQFEDVCTLLSIPISEFVIDSEFIDSQLVKRRNEIAHGNYLDVDYKVFNEEIYHKVIKLLRQFKEKLIDSAMNKRYLRD